jgi:phenylalanyl-tRNA synthetase beta chain
VTAPRTRLDIQAGAADLIEELARVYGYDKLPERLLPLELPVPKGNRALELENRIRDLLADRGLQEAITYSLTSKATEEKLSGGQERFVELLNPISPERSVMRRMLLPEVLAVVQKNFETTDSVAMFELGFVYEPKAGEKLPDEPRRLAIVLCGQRKASGWNDTQDEKKVQFDFFDMKGLIEALGIDLHLPDVSFVHTKPIVWLHPGRAAQLSVNGKAVGVFGELHPKVSASFGLGDRSVQVAEFELESIFATVPERFPYRTFSTFPPAKRDVAVIIPADTPAGRVLDEIRAAGGELLVGAELFDLYSGEGIAVGTKSLAFALTYQAPDRTLSDKEIGKAHEKIEGRLRHVLKAQIRGKDA